MSDTTLAQAEAEHRKDRRIIAEMTATLGASVGYERVVVLTGLILRLAPSLNPHRATWLAQMSAGPLTPTLGFDVGPAQAAEHKMARAWRALYLVVATERLAAGESEATEARYFAAHVRAEARRCRAAALVDQAAELLGDRPVLDGGVLLLGWRAVLDHSTTPECREAHGKNFRADRMPLIGFPGAVHVHCRCSPGPAVPGAPLLPSV